MTVTNARNANEYPDIEYLVLKNFIAVMKRNELYPKFRASVGLDTNNVITKLYSKLPCFRHIVENQSKENIFREAGNIDKFVELMKNSFNGGIRTHDEAKMQQHIGNCTNMLLHIFVERFTRDFQLLEKLGSEIFTLTCQEIFGADFVDKTMPPPEDMENMRRIHELIASGRMPRMSPEMMEQFKRMAARNQALYGGEPHIPGHDDDEEGDEWDEYYYDEDEEFAEGHDDEYYDEEFADDQPTEGNAVDAHEWDFLDEFNAGAPDW